MASAAVVVVPVLFPADLLLVDPTFFSSLVQVALGFFRRLRIILVDCSLIYDGPFGEVSCPDCFKSR